MTRPINDELLNMRVSLTLQHIQYVTGIIDHNTRNQLAFNCLLK